MEWVGAAVSDAPKRPPPMADTECYPEDQRAEEKGRSAKENDKNNAVPEEKHQYIHVEIKVLLSMGNGR